MLAPAQSGSPARVPARRRPEADIRAGGTRTGPARTGRRRAARERTEREWTERERTKRERTKRERTAGKSARWPRPVDPEAPRERAWKP